MQKEESDVVEIVKAHGLLHLDEPVQLRSGQWTRDFIDAKKALAHGDDLALVCQAILDAVENLGVEFDAAGGLTMGADHFAHGVAILGHRGWFTVRKQEKGRGTNKRIEGSDLGPGVRVLLVDDVVTMGGSIQDAYEVIRSTGADIVAAATMVDRGESAARFFKAEHVPYLALVTYRDLGIDPIGSG